MPTEACSGEICEACGAPATTRRYFWVSGSPAYPLCEDCFNELPHPIDLTAQIRRLERLRRRAIPMSKAREQPPEAA